MQIVLASKSLGRKKTLESLGISFEVLPSNIDEDKIIASNPINLVKSIAKNKAEAVFKLLSHSNFSIQNTVPYLIIAADSLVLYAGKTYGKPASKKEAQKLLQMLSGNYHEFITGLAVINTKTNKRYLTSGKSKVIFGKFSNSEIARYVRIANVTLFAGGFAPDLEGGEIIESKMTIQGSVSNVLGGMPIEKLIPILKENGVKINTSRFLAEKK